MCCVNFVILVTCTQAILAASGHENVPSLAELAIAMQHELDQRLANDKNEQRCAAVLRYSIPHTSADSPARISEHDDVLPDCARILIDITQKRYDATGCLLKEPDCIQAAATALLERDEFHDAWLLSQSTRLEPRRRAQILAQVSQAAALKNQSDVARRAVLDLRLLLEMGFEDAAECDERTYLQAMVSSAILDDELNCRWFCNRLSIVNGCNDLLPDYYADDLSGVIANELAFPVMVQVVKDLPSSRLREHLCTFLLFNDRDNSLENDADRLVWLQSQPTVKCASICRKIHLGQLLARDDTAFLMAEQSRLRTTVSWLTRNLFPQKQHSVSNESVRQLIIIAETTLPHGSVSFWFIKSRLASVSIEAAPKFCGECLKDWVDTIEQGAEADILAASSPYMLEVAIALSEVDFCRRILAAWSEKRPEMETTERRLCDAAIMRTLQALPNTVSIGELPGDICSSYPFAVGMTRPRDFQAATETFQSTRDRFWFVAGFLAVGLKDENLITPSIVEFCWEAPTAAVD